MSYCDGLIKQGIQPNCDNPITSGIEQNGVIMNRGDIDFSKIVYDGDRKNVIKTLALKQGAKAYPIYVPSKNPFSGTTTTMEETNTRNNFTNNVGFIILDNDPDVCENIIDSLANGEFVMIYENRYKNLNKETNKGDSSFQIVGFHQGLKATTLENDKWSEDTMGGWNVVLTESGVPLSGLFIYNTDLATTREMIDSLMAA